MSLASQIAALATRLGQEVKADRVRLTALEGAGGATVLTSRLTSAASNSLITYAATGLSVTLAANSTYRFAALGHYRTAATTTGFGVRLGGTVLVTGIRHTLRIWNVSSPTQAQATALATALLTTGVTAANTDYTWEIEGLIRTGAVGGTFTVEFASEVAASAVTVQPDALLLVQLVS